MKFSPPPADWHAVFLLKWPLQQLPRPSLLYLRWDLGKLQIKNKLAKIINSSWYGQQFQNTVDVQELFILVSVSVSGQKQLPKPEGSMVRNHSVFWLWQQFLTSQKNTVKYVSKILDSAVVRVWNSWRMALPWVGTDWYHSLVLTSSTGYQLLGNGEQ